MKLDAFVLSSLFVGGVESVCAPCYEDPPACTGQETAVQITGVTGSFCSPKCVQNQCPKGNSTFTAKPSCVLETQGSSKPTQCALICTPGENAACPEGASCQSIQGEGICTYPSLLGAHNNNATVLSLARTNGAATWTDCSEGGFKVTDVTFDPADIVKGKTTVIAGSMTSDADVTAGSWALSLTWLGAPLPVSGGTGDICEKGTVTLPLSGGTLDVSPFECPLKKGDGKIPNLTLNLAPVAPNGPYTARFSTTMDGKPGLCAELKFTL
jgi:hypothetical protein